jgi:hypothetical protein
MNITVTYIKHLESCVPFEMPAHATIYLELFQSIGKNDTGIDIYGPQIQMSQASLIAEQFQVYFI